MVHVVAVIAVAVLFPGAVLAHHLAQSMSYGTDVGDSVDAVGVRPDQWPTVHVVRGWDRHGLAAARQGVNRIRDGEQSLSEHPSTLGPTRVPT